MCNLSIKDKDCHKTRENGLQTKSRKIWKAVKAANDANLKEMRKELPRYTYPLELVTSTKIAQYSRLGIDFIVPKSQSVPVSKLDAQKAVEGKGIYGNGYFTPSLVRAERERAERERAERDREERFELSAREIKIVKSLNPK